MTPWTCRENCGECCGPVRLPLRIVSRFRNLFQQQPKHEIRDGGFVWLVCEDLLCVFLIRKIRKCRIYSYRPPVCQQYGTIPALQCPYIAMNGTPRRPAEVEEMKRAIDATVDAQIAELLRRVPCPQHS